MPFIAEVILPVYLRNIFHYLVKDEYIPFIRKGKRVLVPFGKSNKLYTGMVYNLYETQEHFHDLKFVQQIIDEVTIVQDAQLEFWNWIAQYYCCSLGEVMLLALPNNLVLYTQSFVNFDEAIHSYDISTASDKEKKIIDFLSKNAPFPYEKLKNTFSEYSIKKLIQKKVLKLENQLINPYKPKLKTFIFLDWENLSKKFKISQDLSSSDIIAAAIQASKSENHQKILLYLLQNDGVEKKFLVNKLQIKENSLKTLEKKRWIYFEKHATDRIQLRGKEKSKYLLSENELQYCEKFIKTITHSLNWAPTVFFHDLGTKRIVFFIEWFKKIKQEGKQILFLVPEIAFTDKFVVELQNVFQDELGIYHSRINEHERVEIWYKVFLKEYKIIIGVRSALFLPFSALGLILIDEEQDVNYKQEEKNPKINIRDASIYYSKMLKIPIILSTQTPSLETFYFTQQKKYQLFSYLKSPNLKDNQIVVVDLKTQLANHQTVGLLTDLSYEAIKKQKIKNHTSVIFVNRKGYSPKIVCNVCGHVHFCNHCDIALTYYKQFQKLKCHYCGYQEESIYFCKNCGSNDLIYESFGTEKIEEQLHILFPRYKIERLDSSNFKTRKQLSDFLQSVNKNEIDIIIGTQLITKLLHLDNIELLVVLLVDMMLYIPNFRAFEYTYQFLRQLINDFDMPYNPSKQLIIQTRIPKNKLFEYLRSGYTKYYHEQILIREELNYPPFSRLIELELQHPNQNILMQSLNNFDKLLRSAFTDMILGPSYPSVMKLKNYYRIQYLVKIPKTQSPNPVKEHIQKTFKDFMTIAKDKNFRFHINVDPK